MSAGQPNAPHDPHSTAADQRQADAILTMLLAGRSIDYVSEQGAVRANGWTRARALEVRDRLVAAGRIPAVGPRYPAPPAGVVAAAPRGHAAVGNTRRYRAMTDDQLLGHCRTHPAGTVRAEGAAIEALIYGARIRLATLRANLPTVDEARELREGQRRRRGDQR